MSRDIAPFGVRMPAELKETVDKAAKENGRSMNAEIVHRLEESFTAEPEDNVLLSAEDAFQAAMKYRKQTAVLVRSYIIEEINDSIIAGKDEALLDLERYCNLDEVSDEMYREVVQPIIDELERAGYHIGPEDGSNFSVHFNQS